MRALLSTSRWLVLFFLLGIACALRAQLVAPPNFTSISLPATASLNQTISISATAQANYSDNSDGNDWDWNNSDMLVIARIMITVQPPSGSPITIHDWVSPWATPKSVTVSHTLNQSGTWYFTFGAMDGRPWYASTLTYGVTVAAIPAAPVITSSLSYGVNQGQYVLYQITATNSPTNRGASGLPSGLSVNTANGQITGYLGISTNATSTITATNLGGSDSKTLTWNVTAASINNTSSVSPASIMNGQSLTLSRSGTTNFGLGWVENVIWQPNGAPVVLGNSGLGSINYTPSGGTGQYYHQTRLVDIYSNFVDRYVPFTVTAAVAAPTTVLVSGFNSVSVSLSWSGAAAALGIASYDIYRDGVKINGSPVTGTTYTDSTALGGVTYNYTIRTVDTVGGLSAHSTAVTATTLASLEVFTPLL